MNIQKWSMVTGNNIRQNRFWTVFIQQHAGKAIGLLLIISTFVGYWQVQGFDFINLDDPSYITENRYVKNGLTPDGFVWAFTEFHAANWHPVTWLSHMLDVQLFGLDAGRHHLVNVLFHILNTLLLFHVLKRMTGSLWRSALVAALFALHPLHVESVAWVSERKDVISAFFWLLTIFLYHQYVKQPSLTKYIWVFAAMALGLMSKPVVVTLPFVLLLLDFWPLKRVGASFLTPGHYMASLKTALLLFREKIPFFILTTLSCWVTIYAQKQGHAVTTMENLEMGTRLANAIFSYLMYLVKLFIPVNLAVFYPHPIDLPLYLSTGAALVLVGISYLVFRQRVKRPYLLVGWLWYVGTLVPVIGLIQVGGQAMADRYTYIPFIGLFIMIAWSAWDLLRKSSNGKLWAGISMMVLLPAMMVMTWVQTGYWKNSITLSEHAVSVTKGNYVAHVMLGSALDERREFQKAIQQYQLALEINPNIENAHINLGNALYRQGQVKKALKHYLAALKINPDYEVIHNNLGLAFLTMGSPNKAISHFRKAILLDPDYAKAHRNLGVAFLRAGQTEMAEFHLQKAAGLDNARE
jgi:tetratricopeptide (TPR) repeat protein